MNLTLDNALSFIYEVNENLPSNDRVETIIFPQSPILSELVNNQGKDLKIGAQNMHYLESGAYTGEISPAILKDLKVSYVLIGHSERRQYYNETNESVNLKIKAAIKYDLIPVFCVGELLESREKGSTNIVLANQIYKGLKDISAEDALKIIVAYEPVWAIGTGKTATSTEANDTIKSIRNMISKLYGKDVSSKVRILYGGSVNANNVVELLSQSDIDGALVGGASLKSASFIKLVEAAL